MNQLNCHNIDKFVIDKSVKQLYIFKTFMYDKIAIEVYHFIAFYMVSLLCEPGKVSSACARVVKFQERMWR